MTVNGIEIITNTDMSETEINKYIEYAIEKYGDVYKLEITVHGDDVDIKTYYNKTAPFTRIRRITGYLTRLEKCNNAKTSEIRERVKHNV